MAEYIDKAEAIRALTSSADYIADALERLDNIPTADVQPVKKAYFSASNNRPMAWMFECSNCGMTAYYPNFAKTVKGCGYRYCPWCGAEIERE